MIVSRTLGIEGDGSRKPGYPAGAAPARPRHDAGAVLATMKGQAEPKALCDALGPVDEQRGGRG